MHPKQYITLGIAIIVLGAGFYFSELQFLSHSSALTPATSPAAQGDTLQSQGVTLAASNATSTKRAGVNFVLSAGGQNYNSTVPAGATVIDAMKVLEARGLFRFTSRNFAGMGAFVESINGRKNSNDLYWILYVNGESAGTGASQTIVKAGDNIEWRYEKGY